MMSKLIEDMFECDGATFAIWIQLFNPEEPWEGIDFARRPDSSPLYVASILGLAYQ